MTLYLKCQRCCQHKVSFNSTGSRWSCLKTMYGQLVNYWMHGHWLNSDITLETVQECTYFLKTINLSCDNNAGRNARPLSCISDTMTMCRCPAWAVMLQVIATQFSHILSSFSDSMTWWPTLNLSVQLLCPQGSNTAYMPHLNTKHLLTPCLCHGLYHSHRIVHLAFIL